MHWSAFSPKQEQKEADAEKEEEEKDKACKERLDRFGRIEPTVAIKVAQLWQDIKSYLLYVQPGTERF